MSTGLVQKLKEGIQDAVVFLRTLEGFKLPAVVQRRAKNLLEKLEELQGDSLRDPPPRFEDSYEEKPAPDPEETQEKPQAEDAQPKAKDAKAKDAKAKDAKSKAKDAKPKATKDAKPKAKDAKAKDANAAENATPKSEEKPPESKPTPVKSPMKKGDSSSIISRVKELEEIDRAAKQEQEAYQRFKFGPRIAEEAQDKTDGPQEAESETAKGEAAVELREKSEELKPPDDKEKRKSAGSLDSGDGVDDEPAKKQKKKSLGIKFFKKSKGREKSPAPQTSLDDGAPPTSDVTSPSPAEEGAEKEEEDDTLPAQLERRGKRFGAHHWSKQTVSLEGTTLVMIGEKSKEERMGLIGCTVGPMDVPNAFEVVNHPEHRQLVFRAETLRGQELWINAIQNAIQECAAEEPPEPPAEGPPEKETKEPEPLPQITVETTEEPSGETAEGAKKGKEARAASAKGAKKQQQQHIPEHGVEIKGFVQRKTGWPSKWEKTWCVVTYNGIYYTSAEENKDYSHFTPLMPDTQRSIQEKKGQGNHPGLIIKVAGKKEHISFESANEAAQWKHTLDQVMGLSGVELLSEDEDDEPDADLDELYEDVGALDRIPEAAGFEDLAEQEIYEEFDDPLPAPYSTSPPSLPPNHPAQPPPSLPPNHPKAQLDAPAPALPPRNSPVLPPRGIPTKPKPPPGVQDYEQATTKAPARPPPPADDDEELYDDVVAPAATDEVQEDYDDVVTAGADVEETYDDVTSPASPGELYEDMAPVEDGPQQEYVIMEPGMESDSDQELYCEVDEPVKVTSSITSSLKKEKKSERTSTFSRVFKGKSTSSSTSSAKGSHSGHLSHCPPGKAKPRDLWCVVDGNQIQLYKGPSDRRPQDKLTLSDHDLEVSGQSAFRLAKAGKGHLFTAKSKEELDLWIGALKGLVKSAVLELEQEESAVFQAKEDHIADNDSQLTFKKGTYIRLISKDNAEEWTGQIGNEAQVFDGKTGKFPAAKVEIAEDLYI